MITDSIIRKKFVLDTIRQGVLDIYARQEDVLARNFNKRTGRLSAHLSRRSFATQVSDQSLSMELSVIPYLRFLDMQYRNRNDRVAKFKRRNIALYNRVVWGILYRETLPELLHGFTDEVRQSVRGQLEKALRPKTDTSFRH